MAVAGFRHVGLKIVSITLASLLWLVVSGEQVVERALRIPLEFTNVPSQLELVGEPPTVVDVRVRGSSGALGRIATGELVAVLDLGFARPGDRLFHLTTADVRAPFGVEVVQVSPSSISMRIETSASKIVPVVPSFEGEPAEGFVVGTVTSDPATVEVLGAESTLSMVTEAITEPVSVAGVSAPFTDTVAIGTTDPAVRLRRPQSARISVNVAAAPIGWSVTAVPVQVRNASRAVQVSPRHVTVFVRGPRDSGGAVAADFDAYVDADGLRTGQFTLPVRVVPPQKVGVVRIEPAQVKVIVK
jgi:YbbR domain-containing protein